MRSTAARRVKAARDDQMELLAKLLVQIDDPGSAPLRRPTACRYGAGSSTQSIAARWLRVACQHHHALYLGEFRERVMSSSA